MLIRRISNMKHVHGFPSSSGISKENPIGIHNFEDCLCLTTNTFKTSSVVLNLDPLVPGLQLGHERGLGIQGQMKNDRCDSSDTKAGPS
ncbi:hypothetical protein AVEN_146789-1 [Araneus ventricosus]|uniref:Uncharacterized protein n=1 Tax=Araneus ventricosus TaxID=182803 RepID=A0A4Y2D7A0_ARAVE|nr:hypothetical protein AVEN_146789-1 [Araneus ventricosus]